MWRHRCPPPGAAAAPRASGPARPPQRPRRHHHPAAVRARRLRGSDAALDLRSRLSATRDPAVLRLRAAIPWCRWRKRLIAEHPHVEARLLIGDDRVSDNPKLNNVIKGWRAASHAWIVITDSNVLLPRDYIDRLFDDLGARHRARLGAADRRPSGQRLGRARMRLPQRLPGALAVRGRQPRLRLRAGQDAVLAAHRPGARRRHPCAGCRACRGRRLDQDGARAGPARAPRRRRLPAAARLACAAERLVAPAALGPAAACDLPARLCAGDLLRPVRAACRLRVRGLGARPARSCRRPPCSSPSGSAPSTASAPPPAGRCRGGRRCCGCCAICCCRCCGLQSWLGNGLSWRGNAMRVAGPGSTALTDWLRRA